MTAVQVGLDGEVAVVTLRRERKLNALSTVLENELLSALGSAQVTTSRAVVVTGGDTVFSAGADVDELRDMTPEAIAEYYRGSGRVYERLAGLPQPTVAAITGYCLGGGLELALASDLRVADPRAVFGLPEVGLGILPSSGGIARLVRALGPARTRDLVLRARRFGPDQAERWGLLTEITGNGEHLPRALELARELTALPPLALAVTKQVIDAAAESSHHTALLLERLAYTALHRTT